MKIRNLLNAGILRIFIGVLLLLGSVGVSGQDNYYNIVSHFSGYESLYADELENISQEVSNTIPIPDGGEEFKVFSYDFYPIMAYVEPREYGDQYESSKSSLENEHDYYLAIFKFFNENAIVEYKENCLKLMNWILLKVFSVELLKNIY